MRCAACGGAVVSIGQRKGAARLQCSTFRESGACSNGRRIKRQDVELLTLDRLRRELTHPAIIAEYVSAYNAERARLRRTDAKSRGKLEQRRGEVMRELERAVDAIVRDGLPAAALAPRINALEAERVSIDKQLAALNEAADGTVLALHPATVARYRDDIAKLERLTAAGRDGVTDGLYDTVRRLIVDVRIDAPANTTDLAIEVRGRLQELLQMPGLKGGYTGGSGGSLPSDTPPSRLLFHLRAAA
jgi:site-specific DNA recombinase